MTKKLRCLESEIRSIKKKLQLLEDLRPGTLSEQYNVCGRPNCRCKEDSSARHGPYCQLSYTRKGKSRTEYIKKAHVPIAENQIQNYAKLHTLINRWVDVSTQICQIKMK